jgi:hypothetical protein
MSVFAQVLALAMMSDAAATAPQPAKPDPLDKVVCHRQPETGSLVRARKECRTKREWDAIA